MQKLRPLCTMAMRLLQLEKQRPLWVGMAEAVSGLLRESPVGILPAGGSQRGAFSYPGANVVIARQEVAPDQRLQHAGLAAALRAYHRHLRASASRSSTSSSAIVGVAAASAF